MSRKGHPFRSGLVAGVAWPLLVVGGVTAIVYRLTGMVPFPIRRSSEGELAIKLVDPDDVGLYWRRWQTELTPLVDRVCDLLEQMRRARGGQWLERE